MRWGGAALGGHPLLAGLIVSLAAFTGALAVLYRLARLDLDEDHAWRVVLLDVNVSWVRALYYSAAYTESLFLLLSVGAFYAMRRRRLGWVAILRPRGGPHAPERPGWALPLACLALERFRLRCSTWGSALAGPVGPPEGGTPRDRC